MKIKCKPRALRRWLASLLCVALLFGTVSVFDAMPKAKAAGMSISELQAKFPQGKYWNHMGSSSNNPDGYTSTPCNHNSYGTKYCNLYSAGGSRQCMGFAQKLGHDYTGIDPINGSGWTFIKYSTNPSGWTNAIENLKTGDIVTYYESTSSVGTHTFFVTSVDGDTVHFAECNWGNKCIIRWDRTMSKSKLKTLHSSKTTVRVSPSTGPNPSVDSCSTAYAGWYQVTGRDGANVNSIHTTNWNSAGPVGALSKGEYVYVSKATGTGSGNLGHITYNGVERYIAMGLFTRMSGDPIGSVDSYGADRGSVWLNGWAFDWDNCEAQLQINVYLDNALVCQGRADGERSDVNAAYSNVIGSYHGFSLRANTNLTGTHTMSVYAINVGNGSHKCIGSVQVNIPGDTEPPTLSNRTVYNVTSEGFDVSVVSTDDVGVDRVVVKAWTNDNDVVEGNATRNGDTYTYHVSISDHGNARGTYYVNMWAYDAAGNYRYFNSPREVVVPEPDSILIFNANGGTAEFTTKQAERGAAYGALPEAWMDGYVFDGWYTDAVGGDRVSSSTVYTAAGQTTLYAHWIPVAADAAQGWALQDGTLIITVQGAMQDYTSARETPWFSNRADIRKIVVQNGVTSIGDYAFYGCENVTSVTLPGTVTQIGKLAFYGCKGLTSLELPESVAVVEDYAFAKASGLKTITFHGSAPLFGAGIFADVNADARCPAGDSSWTDTVRQSYTGSIRWSGVSEAELAAQTSELQLDDPVLESLLADSCV